MANQVIAYILWIFLGIFGVHHFYLKRDRQAFVWWATLGGLFGLGWFRDFWHLPQYVQEANEDEDGYVVENQSAGIDNEGNENRNEANRQRGPKVSVARLGGMMVMGLIFGYLTVFIFPLEFFKRGDKVLVRGFFLVVPPVAVAIGVNLVANIGRLQASKKTCLLGSWAGVIWQFDDPTNIGASCLLSAVAVYFWGIKWRTFRRHRSKCRRLSTLFVCGTIYLSMWGSSLYFNATVTTNDGETIPLREALNNFFTSPAWTKTKETLYLMWQHIRVNGWRNFYQYIVHSIDPQGETNAYKVLGLGADASEETIRARYKKLAKTWHPDKQKDPAKKDEAQEKFLEIQKAYETLSNIKSRRSEKNQRRSQSDEL